MKEDGHVALPRQGWEEAAERPGEVVHASYEVVFAPMVFVRKVGCPFCSAFFLFAFRERQLLRARARRPSCWGLLG